VKQFEHCRALAETTGQPCRVSNNLSPDGLCFWHDPDRAERLADARKRGGIIRARNMKSRLTVPDGEAPPVPRTVEDAAQWAAWATHAVATGRIDHRTAHEVAYSLNALLRALDKVALSDRLKEVEAMIAKLRSA